MEFTKIEILKPEAAKGKMFRLKTKTLKENMVDGFKKIEIEAGSIGYCYACNNGSMFLGFEKETKKIPYARTSPTSFPIAVQFATQAVFYHLEMQK